jgi:hypothetical protein
MCCVCQKDKLGRSSFCASVTEHSQGEGLNVLVPSFWIYMGIFPRKLRVSNSAAKVGGFGVLVTPTPLGDNGDV